MISFTLRKWQLTGVSVGGSTSISSPLTEAKPSSDSEIVDDTWKCGTGCVNAAQLDMIYKYKTKLR